METPIKACVILHIETSKGRVLHHEFESHAELFDFVTSYVLGVGSFDNLTKLVDFNPGEWESRGENYKGPEGWKLWRDADDNTPRRYGIVNVETLDWLTDATGVIFADTYAVAKRQLEIMPENRAWMVQIIDLNA